MIRVLVADDHGVVRAGIRALLAPDTDITVVGEAADGQRALELLQSERAVDVLVLDLSMGGMNGIEVLRQALALRPRLAVLVHSMYAEEQYAARLIREGAAGYLCKDHSEEDLLDAVRTVARGRVFLSRRVQQQSAPAAGHESLTARELQVFMLLAGGASVGDVANELGLGLSTVSTHLGRIRAKLGAQTNGDVVAYAHRHGLVG